MLFKKEDEKTLSWWNRNLMKHQVDEIGIWWNIKLMKKEADETASWWNLMKDHVAAKGS